MLSWWDNNIKSAEALAVIVIILKNNINHNNQKSLTMNMYYTQIVNLNNLWSFYDLNTNCYVKSNIINIEVN